MIVFAHRGASWDEPENTLRAFRRAIELGADYVELDVQATRDSELVVVHDPVQEAFAELRDRYPEVAKLEEVIEECAGRIGPALELKHPWRHRRHRLVERTLAALGRARVDPDSLLVLSFEPHALLAVRRLRPDVRTIQHVHAVPLRVAAGYAWGAGFADARATPRALARARRLGLEAAVYTVNDEARMRELAALGVGGVFTDRPDLLLRVLGR